MCTCNLYVHDVCLLARYPFFGCLTSHGRRMQRNIHSSHGMAHPDTLKPTAMQLLFGRKHPLHGVIMTFTGRGQKHMYQSIRRQYRNQSAHQYIETIPTQQVLFVKRVQPQFSKPRLPLPRRGGTPQEYTRHKHGTQGNHKGQHRGTGEGCNLTETNVKCRDGIVVQIQFTHVHQPWDNDASNDVKHLLIPFWQTIQCCFCIAVHRF